jgi:nucleoside 2-deoxyribosyltransferase
MYFYVIMPVGADEQFAAKKSIIQKVAQKENLTPYFPFDRNGNISFDIKSTLSTLKGAEFVLADLSMERPSCYFELGLAQASGKDVYLIAQKATDIHQAHGRNLTYFYDGLQNYEQIISVVLKEAKRARLAPIS